MRRETGSRALENAFCSKNGGKGSLKSDAKPSLLQENAKTFQLTFCEQNISIGY